MRYYELYTPEQLDERGTVKKGEEPNIYTSVRTLRDLPDGTLVVAIITDRDGGVVEGYVIPVVGGKPQIQRNGVRRPKMYWG